MTDAEAIEICEAWFAYLALQSARAHRAGQLAAIMRRGTQAEKDEARRELQRGSVAPTVFDGGTLEPAVRHLVKRVSR